MGLFRKKNQTQIPELQEYYASQQQRPIVAWLKALATLIVTALIIIVLFLAGRWAYRTFIANDDATNDNSSLSEQQEELGELGEADGVVESESTTETSEGAVGTSSASTSTPNTAEDVRQSQSGDSTTPLPTSGPTSGELPRTGPIDAE